MVLREMTPNSAPHPDAREASYLVSQGDRPLPGDASSLRPFGERGRGRSSTARCADELAARSLRAIR